jgi:peptide/nickel transport system permease protein
MNKVAIFVLAATLAMSLLAGWIAPAGFAHQFRESPNAAPSRQFLLGTDELGRDSLARLLYGTRVSLLLAPAAALFSVCLAAVIGGIAGFYGGWMERGLMTVTNLFLSLPWLFVLVAARGVMPLNISPIVSVVITFVLLGAMGWAASARVICGGARSVRGAEFVLQAQASGCRPVRLVLFHVVPNLRPALAAQFWASIPVFILTEANLGLLGLGVAEPLPSWGGLLRELEHHSAMVAQPWRLAPLLLLVVVVSAFQFAMARDEVFA